MPQVIPDSVVRCAVACKRKGKAACPAGKQCICQTSSPRRFFSRQGYKTSLDDQARPRRRDSPAHARTHGWRYSQEALNIVAAIYAQQKATFFRQNHGIDEGLWEAMWTAEQLQDNVPDTEGNVQRYVPRPDQIEMYRRGCLWNTSRCDYAVAKKVPASQ